MKRTISNDTTSSHLSSSSSCISTTPTVHDINNNFKLYRPLTPFHYFYCIYVLYLCACVCMYVCALFLFMFLHIYISIYVFTMCLRVLQIRELQALSVTAADDVTALQQQLDASSQHVDSFLTTVTRRLSPILRMLQENTSPISATPEVSSEQKEGVSEEGGEGVDFRLAQQLVLGQLDTIQHTSAYYHDLLVYLIGNRTCIVALINYLIFLCDVCLSRSGWLTSRMLFIFLCKCIPYI